jgi:disulfide bond formation protein DsbB
VKRRTLTLGFAALALAACGSPGDGAAGPTLGPEAVGDVAEGRRLYERNCTACHRGGEGVEGLGKPLIGSAFVAERSDRELVAFLGSGRPAGDPLNTTGVDMPPRGGNPSLDNRDLLDIVAFIRTLG